MPSFTLQCTHSEPFRVCPHCAARQDPPSCGRPTPSPACPHLALLLLPRVLLSRTPCSPALRPQAHLLESADACGPVPCSRPVPVSAGGSWWTRCTQAWVSGSTCWAGVLAPRWGLFVLPGHHVGCSFLGSLARCSLLLLLGARVVRAGARQRRLCVGRFRGLSWPCWGPRSSSRPETAVHPRDEVPSPSRLSAAHSFLNQAPGSCWEGSSYPCW